MCTSCGIIKVRLRWPDVSEAFCTATPIPPKLLVSREEREGGKGEKVRERKEEGEEERKREVGGEGKGREE